MWIDVYDAPWLICVRTTAAFALIVILRVDKRGVTERDLR